MPYISPAPGSESLAPPCALVPGTMAHAFATHDWASTRLGPVAGWSEVLKQTVRSMLALPFAGALFWGPELLLLYNDGYRTFLGGKHPSALGIPAAASWAEVWPVVGKNIADAFHTGAVTSVRNIFIPILLDGRMVDRYWTYCFYPVYDGREIVGVSQTAFDSTSEVLAERGLKESEARASRILQSIGDAVIVTDAQKRITRMNPVAEHLTGWQTEDANGRDLAEVFRILHELTRGTAATPADTVLRTGTAAPLENHTLLLHQDGTERPIEHSGAPIRDDAGDLSGIVLTFRDVTERQRAAKALARSEDRVHLALSAANGVGTWDWDLVNERVYTDARFAHFFGLASHTPLGTPVSEFVDAMHPADRARVRKQIEETFQGKREFASEYRVVQPDGTYRWLLSVGRAIDTEQGLRFSGIAVETTERKRAEQALDSSEMRFQLALETAHLGAWELDIETGMLTTTATCKAQFGRQPEDSFTYAEFLAAVHPEDRDAIDAAVWHAVAQRSMYRAEYRVIWPDSSLHWIVASGSVAEDDREAKRMTGVTMDVTERRQATAALLQAEKLAAVGRLAAAIAHEINNPLEAVTNLLFLAQRTEHMEPLQQYLELADRELRRVSAISNQTLRFHRQSTRPSHTTGAEIMDSVLTLHQARILNARVTVTRRIRAQRPVLCFEGEIRQVISNLVTNAVDAMAPHGGRLLLRSREATHWATGRAGLLITVADTGSGISAEVRKRIFEPFFTTKDIAGTGLGLWVSQEIITRHEGVLRLRSSARPGGSGTVFTVFLPLVSEQVRADAAGKTSSTNVANVSLLGTKLALPESAIAT